MAQLQPAILQPGVALGTTAVTVYSAGSVNQAIISRAVFSNVSGSATTLLVSITRKGGTALPISYNIALSANEAYIANELGRLTLAAGDSISASCGAAGAVNCFISGFTQ